MYSDWQLGPPPAPPADTEEQRSPVLARLVDEQERADAPQAKEAAQRQQTGSSMPRPFVHD